MGEPAQDTARFNRTDRYTALMDVVRNRITNRAFAPYEVPREHFEMILEAARHAPSGANAQPWHYIVVTDPAVKQTIGQYFVDEQQHRARAAHGIPHPQLQRRQHRSSLDRGVGRFPLRAGFSGLERRFGARPYVSPER